MTRPCPPVRCGHHHVRLMRQSARPLWSQFRSHLGVGKQGKQPGATDDIARQSRQDEPEQRKHQAGMAGRDQQPGFGRSGDDMAEPGQ